MGCCKSKIEGQEINLCYRDVKDAQEAESFRSGQGFNDISLNSHDEFGEKDGGQCRTFEFFTPGQRSTSISVHKSDLEAAFVQQFQLVSIFPQGKNLD